MRVTLAVLFVVLVATACAQTEGDTKTQAPPADSPAASTANAAPAAAAAAKPDAKAAVAALFAADCTRCHGGEKPPAKLPLAADTFETALVDVKSSQIDTLKLVDTVRPARSYVLLKVKGDKRIKGKTMPIGAPALDAAEIKALELWIADLAVLKAKAAAETAAPTPSPTK